MGWLLGGTIATAGALDRSLLDPDLDPALLKHPLIFPGVLQSGQRFSQGFVTTDITGTDDGIRAILIQPDGKILVVGWSDNGTYNDFAMARYGADGTLDQTFGTGGIVVSPFLPGDSIIHAVALDSSNRIVVAGRIMDADWDFLVSRYMPDGSLDTSFGTGGHVQVDFAGSEFARALAIDSAGRIVVVGYSNQGNLGTYSFAVARLLTDGSLDTAFSGDGKQTANFPGNTFCTAYAVLIDGSDRIIAAGRTRTSGGDNDFAIARFTTAGALDNTFSGDGMHSQSFSTDDIAWAAAFDETGRIVLAGRSRTGSQYDMHFARYTTAGAEDGNVAIAVGSGGIARGIQLDEANRFVVSGHVYDGSVWNFATMRVLNTGLLDNTYGTAGVTLTAIGAGDDDALSLAYAPGVVFAAGRSFNGSDLDFAIARYDINGSLATSGTADPNLNSTGITTSALGSASSVPYTVAVQTDHRIVVGGYSNNGSRNIFTTVRYRADGTLDTTFNTTGSVTTDVSGYNSVINAIRLTPDGRIVAAGNAYSGSDNDFAIARYLTNGSPDTSFGTTGRITRPIGAGDDHANALAIDSDGRIVVVGSTINGTAKNLAVARFLSNGTIDTSFGTSGVVRESFGIVPIWHQADQQINHGNNGATQLSVARPTNVSAGDLIIVLASVRGTTRPVPAPTGFTLIRTENGGGNNTGYISAYYKIATSSEPATYTMASNPGDNWFAISGRVTGHDPANPIGNNSGANSATTSVTSLELPSLNITVENSLLIAVWQNRNATTNAAAPMGMTSHWAHNTPNPMTIGASQLMTATGATGTRTATWTGGERAAGLMFAIRPGGPPTSGFDDTGYAVLLDSSNRIIVGGQSTRSAVAARFGLMRLLSNGALDSTFSNDGRVTTDVSGTWGGQLLDMAFDDEGRIVAVGRTFGLRPTFAIARYLTNGSLDPSFNTTGILVTPIGANASEAYGVATHNGKIIVTGTSGAPSAFTVARFLSDGSLDTSFNTTGIYSTTIGSGDSIAHAVALDPAGRIVVTGTTFNTNWNFATMRLFP